MNDAATGSLEGFSFVYAERLEHQIMLVGVSSSTSDVDLIGRTVVVSNKTFRIEGVKRLPADHGPDRELIGLVVSETREALAPQKRKRF